jgi:hypothetical protein
MTVHGHAHSGLHTNVTICCTQAPSLISISPAHYIGAKVGFSAGKTGISVAFGTPPGPAPAPGPGPGAGAAPGTVPGPGPGLQTNP